LYFLPVDWRLWVGKGGLIRGGDRTRSMGGAVLDTGHTGYAGYTGGLTMVMKRGGGGMM
jgi:hypothetical protein